MEYQPKNWGPNKWAPKDHKTIQICPSIGDLGRGVRMKKRKSAPVGGRDVEVGRAVRRVTV